MFEDAASFNQDVSGWDVSHVNDFTRMFAGTVVFNQDLSSWNVSASLDFSGMFEGALSFNQSLCEWGPLLSDSSASLDGMFADTNCSLLMTDASLSGNPPGPFCSLCSPLNVSY
jgi:surface protein